MSLKLRPQCVILMANRDMTMQDEVFNNSLALFASDSEEIRAAAAFAVGKCSHYMIPLLHY